MPSDKSKKLFLSIGLDEKIANETVNNSKITIDLTAVIHEAGLTDGCDRAIGNFLYSVTTKLPSGALVHRPTLIKYIVSSKIKTPAQLEAAFTFFKTTSPEAFKLNEFEEACGVGIEVSREDIEKTVKEIFEENKNTILEKRYRFNEGLLHGQVRKIFPWADPTIVKEFIGENMFELLGERTAADNEKPVKKKENKEKPAKTEEKKAVTEPSEEEANPFSIFPH